MTKDEALKMALEALEIEHSPIYGTSQTAKAIKFIKEALSKNEFKPDWDEKIALTEEVIRLSKRIEELEAQPSVSVEQEPVFWYKPYPNGMYNGPIYNAQIGDVLRGSEEWTPLYTKEQL